MSAAWPPSTLAACRFVHRSAWRARPLRRTVALIDAPTEDVRRVRQRLRDLGFTRKIPYNMDETTLQRWYGPGAGRYYE